MKMLGSSNQSRRPRQTRRKKNGVVSAKGAHHVVWYDCLCSEAGSILQQNNRRRWLKDLMGVRTLKLRSRERCTALVNHEATVIGSWEETLPIYAPYMYYFVHLTFPVRRFPTKKVAASFLTRAFASNDPDDVLRPYRRQCVELVFDIWKDQETRETDVTVEEGEGEAAWECFVSAHG
jgi:hypothetical protein